MTDIDIEVTSAGNTGWACKEVQRHQTVALFGSSQSVADIYLHWSGFSCQPSQAQPGAAGFRRQESGAQS